MIPRNVTIKRIASGFYESRFPVTLIADGRKIVVTAYAEIIRREDGSGWSFTLKAPYKGFAAYLSAHDDVYEAKSHIVEFFRSEQSRYWQYITEHGLNSWCMATSTTTSKRRGEERAMSTITRSEHLTWCKQRALEYLQPGPYFSLDDAMASMVSDLGKHDDTRHHLEMTVPLMFQLRAAGKLNTATEMRDFIQGFN